MSADALIKKPKPVTFTQLKKISITEATYSKAIQYLEWNQYLDGEADLGFLIDRALSRVFDEDKGFKKHLKAHETNNNQSE